MNKKLLFKSLLLFVFTNICATNISCTDYFDRKSQSRISESESSSPSRRDLRELNGKVIKVSDGDTFTMLTNDDGGSEKVRVRLYAIDAPEKKQLFGKESAIFLSEMIKGRYVTVSCVTKDRYKRVVGLVSTSSDPNINLKMIRNGMAWHYKHYDQSKKFDEAERLAKSERRGLWQHDNPTPPWKWRQINKGQGKAHLKKSRKRSRLTEKEYRRIKKHYHL